MLQQKANLFALKMGPDDAKASKGCLDHFKSHHNITLHKICGESEAVPAGSVIVGCQYSKTSWGATSPGMSTIWMRLQCFSTCCQIGQMQLREEKQGTPHHHPVLQYRQQWKDEPTRDREVQEPTWGMYIAVSI
ncbi:hypothetical protein PR048_023900 [Dryococelus australis]|uniref:HTH CENPB-type domain-containing protein n=1 Tax=Dryococelus australis TaxID=614101 RepID=A0ABQ9GVG2_9NEOP|nr:hypothetical protein PR048_023900 [Dryococelus australis]